jgi:hypothetical protein
MIIRPAIIVPALALGLAVVALDPPAASAADAWDSPAKRRGGKRKVTKPHPAGGRQPAEAVEEEEEAPAAIPAEPVRERPRSRKAAVEEDAAEGEEEEEEEDRSRLSKRSRRKPVDEEEEEEEDDEEEDDPPFQSHPVVLPRLFAVGLGGSLMGRAFGFDNGTLQKDTNFPRVGVAVGAEVYPMIRMRRGWWRKIGVGIAYGRESGRATSSQTDGGEYSYPVSQSRWSLDVRYVIPIGKRVTLVPALGYGSTSFDIERAMPVSPNTCTTMVTMPCVPDVNAKYMIADFAFRLAATPTLGLSLVAGYYLGLSVQGGDGQLADDAFADVSGFHADIGATFLVNDWLAVQGVVPIRRYGYDFNPGPMYTIAAETQYGLMLGAVVVTR